MTDNGHNKDSLHVKSLENLDIDTLRNEYNKTFTNNLGVNKIFDLPQRPGWIRKGVITNYSAAHGAELVRNYKNHLEMGYRIYLSTEQVTDERKFSPNTNSRPNTVPAPITGKTSDGFEYVAMEIEESKLKEEFEKRAMIAHQKLLASTGTQKVENKVHNTGSAIVEEVHIKANETKF